MKKTLLALAMCLMAVSALAQGGRAARHMVNFESRNGESFSVFIDGNVVNRLPQTRVQVTDLTGDAHEVVVVLKRPAQKAAVVTLQPAEATVTVNVEYNQQTDNLSLYTPTQGGVTRVKRELQQRPVEHERMAPAQPEALLKRKSHRDVHKVSGDDLAGMVERMKAQPTDSDRLSMGKVMVGSSDLTAEQIARLAETLDYSTSKVDFLKYAYEFCIDPINYHKTTDVLQFSSDKKRVLDFIATQK